MWTIKVIKTVLSDSINLSTTLARPANYSRLQNRFIGQKMSCVFPWRLVSYTTSSWKATESASNTSIDKMNQFTKRSQRPQKRLERIRPSSSRTPWLESGRKLLIWEGYKRNHKGAIPPVKTRARCKRGKDKICGNPCPICKNSVNVHFRNTKLLEQFICNHTGQILEPIKTGLCRQQQKRVVAAIEKAWDYGLISFTVPRQLSEESLGIPPWNKLDTK